MASTAVSQLSKGEFISHVTGLRMRVTGVGSLLMTLYSLDQAYSQVLVAYNMFPSTNKEMTRLANFSQQRIKLRMGTTEINERFKF